MTASGGGAQQDSSKQQQQLPPLPPLKVSVWVCVSLRRSRACSSTSDTALVGVEI